MITLIRRVRNWRHGIFQPPVYGGVDDPPICICGHYRYRHTPQGCFGWARDQWARLGPLSLDLRCRCRVAGSFDPATKEDTDAHR